MCFHKIGFATYKVTFADEKEYEQSLEGLKEFLDNPRDENGRTLICSLGHYSIKEENDIENYFVLSGMEDVAEEDNESDWRGEKIYVHDADPKIIQDYLENRMEYKPKSIQGQRVDSGLMEE